MHSIIFSRNINVVSILQIYECVLLPQTVPPTPGSLRLEHEQLALLVLTGQCQGAAPG